MREASPFLWYDQHTDQRLQHLKAVFDTNAPALLSVTATSAL